MDPIAICYVGVQPFNGEVIDRVLARHAMDRPAVRDRPVVLYLVAAGKGHSEVAMRHCDGRSVFSRTSTNQFAIVVDNEAVVAQNLFQRPEFSILTKEGVRWCD